MSPPCSNVTSSPFFLPELSSSMQRCHVLSHDMGPVGLQKLPFLPRDDMSLQRERPKYLISITNSAFLYDTPMWTCCWEIHQLALRRCMQKAFNIPCSFSLDCFWCCWCTFEAHWKNSLGTFCKHLIVWISTIFGGCEQSLVR